MVEVAPLPITYSWHGIVYPTGCTKIPEDLAIALGLTSESETLEPANKSQNHGSQNAALDLINSVTAASELEILPGIGPANASRVFQAKPDAGYESLEAVALVPELSSAIDWDAIEAWEPEA